MLSEAYLNQLLALAYQEDIGNGDHTSLACIDKNASGKAKLLAKQKGIVAGVELAKYVCNYFSKNIKITTYLLDGAEINPGDIILEISGPQIDILGVERTLLNFMQRMSGIATETRRYVEKIQDLNTKLLDTRKTTPGLRLIEKEAVRIGGANNHRIGLYDMIMIKDNHIDYSSSIEQAIIKANQYINENHYNLKIEIEVRNIVDLKKVMSFGKVDRILLDNFTIEDTKTAVAIINGKFETESSGGITIDNIRDYALCGVDYISVGAITHQVKSLDLSLLAC